MLPVFNFAWCNLFTFLNSMSRLYCLLTQQGRDKSMLTILYCICGSSWACAIQQFTRTMPQLPRQQNAPLVPMNTLKLSLRVHVCLTLGFLFSKDFSFHHTPWQFGAATVGAVGVSDPHIQHPSRRPLCSRPSPGVRFSPLATCSATPLN